MHMYPVCNASSFYKKHEGSGGFSVIVLMQESIYYHSMLPNTLHSQKKL